MATYKITEELDKLQKKVAALREIYKHHPDTTVKITAIEETYVAHSVNSSVDIIKFTWGQGWLRAYTSKIYGCIELCSSPPSFSLLSYFPDDTFNKQLMVQGYHDSMRNHGIPENLIRECDLRVIGFIKNRNIDLSKSNINDVNTNSSIGKLLLLL